MKEPEAKATWLAILTFSRAQGAKNFLERFKDYPELTFGIGTADKVILFSHDSPEVIHHLCEWAMRNSVITYTVNKIRVPKDYDGS